jgi:FLYWCH zinc finger domain
LLARFRRTEKPCSLNAVISQISNLNNFNIFNGSKWRGEISPTTKSRQRKIFNPSTNKMSDETPNKKPFKILNTIREKHKIIYDGFVYHFYHENDLNKYWRCINRKCNAKLISTNMKSFEVKK